MTLKRLNFILDLSIILDSFCLEFPNQLIVQTSNISSGYLLCKKSTFAESALSRLNYEPSACHKNAFENVYWNGLLHVNDYAKD